MKTSRKLCKGIWEMPAIKDHPEWWCLLSLAGFGSHLNTDALEVFAKYKILIFKEEGDASQVYQPYDQQVTTQDERMTRKLLNGFRFNRYRVVGDFELM